MAVGDAWVYRCSGNCAGETRRREIVRREQRLPGGASYYLMQDGGSETWLRLAEDGRLLALDPASGAERQWYAFAAGVGEEYRTGIHPCNPSAKIASKQARYSGPAGELANVLQVTYTNTCNAAGLVEEKFSAGLGMVQRVEEVGAVRYDLISARAGGRAFPAPPQR